MVKTVLFASLIVFTLFAPKAYAEVTIKQGESRVNVRVDNTTNSDANVSTNCNTSVKITQNGETKSYQSSDCNKDVNVQSDNGDAKVEIKSESGGKKVEVTNEESSRVVEENSSPNPTNEEAQGEVKKIVEKSREARSDSAREREAEQENFFKVLLDSFLSFITLERNN